MCSGVTFSGVFSLLVIISSYKVRRLDSFSCKKGAEAPLNFALKKSVARMLASYG